MKPWELRTFPDYRNRIEKLYAFYINHIFLFVTISFDVVHMDFINFIFQEFDRRARPLPSAIVVWPVRCAKLILVSCLSKALCGMSL